MGGSEELGQLTNNQPELQCEVSSVAEEPTRSSTSKRHRSTASRCHQLKQKRVRVFRGSEAEKMIHTCWWCHRPGVTQTRDHLFEACTARRKQQKVLWKEVGSQTKRGRDRFRIADLFADERCTDAILTFLKD